MKMLNFLEMFLKKQTSSQYNNLVSHRTFVYEDAYLLETDFKIGFPHNMMHTGQPLFVFPRGTKGSIL